MTEQPIDWQGHPYFKNKENLEAFTTADMIDWLDPETGKREDFYSPELPEVPEGHPHTQANLLILRCSRDELPLFRKACKDIKGQCDYRDPVERERRFV